MAPSKILAVCGETESPALSSVASHQCCHWFNLWTQGYMWVISLLVVCLSTGVFSPGHFPPSLRFQRFLFFHTHTKLDLQNIDIHVVIKWKCARRTTREGLIKEDPAPYISMIKKTFMADW
jgi:hypothetical protein